LLLLSLFALLFALLVALLAFLLLRFLFFGWLRCRLRLLRRIWRLRGWLQSIRCCTGPACSSS
jgi:small-conductance mechanosensitive channel